MVDKEVTSENWNYQKILCNRPVFLKRGVCKHNMTVAVGLKLAEVPDNAKYDDAPIGAKPKRGRPPKAQRGEALKRTQFE